MDNSSLFVWIDGEYWPWHGAKIHALSQTLHYGFGVYEGLRSYATDKGPAIFRLPEHTRRLYASAAILNLDIPVNPETVNQVCIEMVKKNSHANAYIRPMVFVGNEFLGLHTQISSVHLMVVAMPWQNAYANDEKLKKGIVIKTSSYERIGARNGLSKAKANGLYLMCMLANNEAKLAGCDDALMLDAHGYVAEGSASNIFYVKSGVLYTPDLSAILDGITRRTIIQFAEDAGIRVVEKRITRDELYTADEVFFTGTAAEVLPVVSIDDRSIADGKPGCLTQKFQALYFSTVKGCHEKYERWLSFTQKNLEYT